MTTEARAVAQPSPARSPTMAHPRAAPAQRAYQQNQPTRERITGYGPDRAPPGAAPVHRPGPARTAPATALTCDPAGHQIRGEPPRRVQRKRCMRGRKGIL